MDKSSSETGRLATRNAPPNYARTPRDLLRDPSITAQAKTLWTLLEDHASPGAEEPWPGQQRLADMLGVTTRTVRSWMAELVKAGWLETKQTRLTNVHTLVWKTSARKSTSRLARKPASGELGSVLPTKKNQKEELVEEPISSSSNFTRLEPQAKDDDGLTSHATQQATIVSKRLGRNRPSPGLIDATREAVTNGWTPADFTRLADRSRLYASAPYAYYVTAIKAGCVDFPPANYELDLTL